VGEDGHSCSCKGGVVEKREGEKKVPRGRGRKSSSIAGRNRVRKKVGHKMRGIPGGETSDRKERGFSQSLGRRRKRKREKPACLNIREESGKRGCEKAKVEEKQLPR